MNWTTRIALWAIVALLSGAKGSVGGGPEVAAERSERPPSRIILDTDIGDDIDDAFALALAFESPEIRVIGVTTAWGNTALRARLVNRFLKETAAGAVPVVVGI